jgi:hypothetical protein
MRPRLAAPIIFLTFAVLALLGAVLAGFFVLAFYPISGAQLVRLTAGVIRGPFQAGLTVLVLGGLSGTLAWLLLFALRRDGLHRMETAALLPRNYGGRSPFDL